MVAGKVGNYFFHPISSILIFCVYLSWGREIQKIFWLFSAFLATSIFKNITTQEIVLSQLQSHFWNYIYNVKHSHLYNKN